MHVDAHVRVSCDLDRALFGLRAVRCKICVVMLKGPQHIPLLLTNYSQRLPWTPAPCRRPSAHRRACACSCYRSCPLIYTPVVTGGPKGGGRLSTCTPSVPLLESEAFNLYLCSMAFSLSLREKAIATRVDGGAATPGPSPARTRDGHVDRNGPCKSL